MPHSALERAVEEALAAVRADAAHNLDRPQRLAIHAALGPRLDHAAPGGEIGWRHRSLLDILAAERVLPLWVAGASRTSRPPEEIELPMEWLQEAREAMLHPPSPRERKYTLGYTWGQAEALGSGETAKPSSCAMFAAQKALHRALNDLGFDPENANWDLTDQQTYPSYMDAAFYASCAAADGFPWDQRSDPARRLEFWTWWLTEAVPTAWASVPDDTAG